MSDEKYCGESNEKEVDVESKKFTSSVNGKVKNRTG